jgi:hypothetical protein
MNQTMLPPSEIQTTLSHEIQMAFNERKCEEHSTVRRGHDSLGQ